MSGKQGARPSLHVAQRPESESLRKVKSGEMSLEEYLEERTEGALAHLIGKVPGETLDNIRFVLREKIRTDPVLVEAVRRATGKTPRPLVDLGNN